MKTKLPFYLILSLFLFQNVNGQTQNMSNESFRQNYMAETKQKFPDVQQDFFEIKPEFMVNATIRLLKKDKIEELKTSAKKIKLYTEYALLRFEINNKQYKLTAYAAYPVNESYANHLFIPFKDKTSGELTYGGGRYVDLDKRDLEHNYVIIDFNKSYNPYCAFSYDYNCPIPPTENQLDVEILAGEKIPKGNSH